MNLCQIVPSLEEKHGGPSKSVLALSGALARAGSAVDLFTTHPTSVEQRKIAELNVGVYRRNWPESICRSAGLKAAVLGGIYDVVHHHALWLRTLQYAAAACARRQTPLVISPRGMMSQWAWNHHGWRKQIARHLIHPGALERAAGWHATSVEEEAEIRALGFKQPVCVAPNGVVAPDDAAFAAAQRFWQEACPATKDRPVAVFYSRFPQKKRVLELIDLWLSESRGEWLLLLVGLSGDFTASQLKTYAMRASAGDRIEVFDGEGLPPPYAVASLFLLPSHSENFGLVIAEAMAHGVPVLVTDGTPWSGVNEQQLGWCVPWDDYAKTLKSVLAETGDSLKERGARAKTWVLENFSWDYSAKLLREFYSRLIGRQS